MLTGLLFIILVRTEDVAIEVLYMLGKRFVADLERIIKEDLNVK